ncbi:MAG: aldo/keto reductase [Chloroflexi bacterium]|nr:aldo/keto reductase [Chloroflexota bacterium]
MKYRQLGSLSVSIVGIGCNNFGGRIDEPAAHAVVHAALDTGINFFDTADVYGSTKSEEYLGRALGDRRGEALIATKFGHRIDDQRKGAHPEYIRQAVEDSLRRLGTDVIDLYQLHTPDATVPIADTLGALDDLVKAGKVRQIGCSNFTVEMLQEAEAAVKPGAARFVSVQNHYSLFHFKPELPVIAECARASIGYLPYFPLASGLLTGKYRRGEPVTSGRLANSPRKDQLLTEENFDKVEQLTAYAEQRGHTILDLAFGWLLWHQVIPSVIAGATKPEQVHANAAASSWILTDDEVAEINAIMA